MAEEKKKRRSLYDAEDKKVERGFKAVEKADAHDKQPEAKSDTKPVKEPHGEKGGTEEKHEDGKEKGRSEIHERHHKEREHLHQAHEGERKDLHGTHREQHRQMHHRHEKAWKDLNAKQDNELEGGVEGATQAPEMQQPAGSPMAPGSGA
jgi:hypothetical protein